jgi:hypothetical protein
MSKGIGVESPGATRPMLAERLVCEACQGILGLTKGSVPALVGVQLFEDGGRKLVLLPFRQAASGHARKNNPARGLSACRAGRKYPQSLADLHNASRA